MMVVKSSKHLRGTMLYVSNPMHRRASRTAPISGSVGVLFRMVEPSLTNSLSVIGVNLELGIVSNLSLRLEDDYTPFLLTGYEKITRMDGNVNEKADHENTIGVDRDWGGRLKGEGILYERCDFVVHLLLLSGSDEVACVVEEDIADPEVVSGGELERRPLDVVIDSQQAISKPEDGLQIRVVLVIAR